MEDDGNFKKSDKQINSSSLENSLLRSSAGLVSQENASTREVINVDDSMRVDESSSGTGRAESSTRNQSCSSDVNPSNLTMPMPRILESSRVVVQAVQRLPPPSEPVSTSILPNSWSLGSASPVLQQFGGPLTLPELPSLPRGGVVPIQPPPLDTLQLFPLSPGLENRPLSLSTGASSHGVSHLSSFVVGRPILARPTSWNTGFSPGNGTLTFIPYIFYPGSNWLTMPYYLLARGHIRTEFVFMPNVLIGLPEQATNDAFASSNNSPLSALPLFPLSPGLENNGNRLPSTGQATSSHGPSSLMVARPTLWNTGFSPGNGFLRFIPVIMHHNLEWARTLHPYQFAEGIIRTESGSVLYARIGVPVELINASRLRVPRVNGPRNNSDLNSNPPGSSY